MQIVILRREKKKERVTKQLSDVKCVYVFGSHFQTSKRSERERLITNERWATVKGKENVSNSLMDSVSTAITTTMSLASNKNIFELLPIIGIWEFFFYWQVLAAVWAQSKMKYFFLFSFRLTQQNGRRTRHCWFARPLYSWLSYQIITSSIWQMDKDDSNRRTKPDNTWFLWKTTTDFTCLSC